MESVQGSTGRKGHNTSPGGMLDRGLKRTLDIAVAAALLLVLTPVIAAVALAIVLDSPGPVFYRARRVGYRGRDLWMLKFRKMHETASGPALTVSDDARLTRVGRFLAASKLDEVPQLWNVVRGEMSLVGPRPEDHSFVELHAAIYETITAVRPGMTGLSQLAFAEESRILDPSDRLGHYVERLLPQKTKMDALYASRRNIRMDLGILVWTVAAVLLRKDVAVHRQTGKLNLRRRGARQAAPALEQPERVVADESRAVATEI
jgi:lipopolysaccharide/colanic/teichoic acid biosynthesis glycosyltransferase